MFNADWKLQALNGNYRKQLQAIFNNAEEMENKKGDISDWTTQDYAEYCARFRIYTYKGLSTFKSVLKNGYIKLLGKPYEELADLDLHLVYSKVQNLHIKVYWTSLISLMRTISTAIYDELESQDARSIFTYDSALVASMLLYCGIDFVQLPTIKRDAIIRNGIWSLDLPTKIAKQTRESEEIMRYARQNSKLEEEYRINLPLVRDGKSDERELSYGAYRRILTELNNTDLMSVEKKNYDITTQNIVLSGEFSRYYNKYGTIEKPDMSVLEPISHREYVKVNDVSELYNLYTLYCMLAT